MAATIEQVIQRAALIDIKLRNEFEQREREEQQRARGQFPLVRFSTPKQGNIKELLIRFISQEEKRIRGALYRFTLYDVALAMVDAMERNVKIRLLLDSEYKNELCDALLLVSRRGVNHNGARLQTYGRPSMGRDKFANIHHKFFVFSRNVDNKKLVWTGSYNPTGKSDQHNWENVIILDDPETVEQFMRAFNDLLEDASKVISREDCHCTKTKSDYVKGMNAIPGYDESYGDHK